MAESLLCENICVATDVGDSSFLLKDVGFVVDPCNSKELCEAWSSIMDLSESDREEISKNACMEFDEMVRTLRANHITVEVFETEKENTPDSVFPNNWLNYLKQLAERYSLNSSES